MYPVDCSLVDLADEHTSVRILGIEKAYTSPPTTETRLPDVYQSPEVMLEKTQGRETDLWAAGCTLFSIGTGRDLWFQYDYDNIDSFLEQIVNVVGKLPEPYWSTTWETRKESFLDQADEGGRPIEVIIEAPWHFACTESEFHGSVSVGARSLQDKLRPGMWYDICDEGEEHREISQDDIRNVAVVLTDLLHPDKTQRVLAEDLRSYGMFRHLSSQPLLGSNLLFSDQTSEI